MKSTLLMAVMFGLAGAAFAGDIEDLAGKAPALPAIDAGAIWNQVNQHPFPQPGPAILDVCVFTEFKDNKCYYKCESGAVIAEPTIKPIVGAGGSAGVCGTHIIRAIKDPLSLNKADLNWKKAEFTATDGTKIVVDYSPLSLGGEIIAAPLWVTVVKPGMGFTGGERIRAMIMNYYDSSNIAANTLFETQQLDLKPVPPGSYGHGPLSYQAQGQRVELSQSHIGYGYNFRQEIAVVVDGKWLSDPVNGSHNFKFKMVW